jgi:hypothetical protein
MSWPAPKPTPIAERIERRLIRTPWGCWVWTGARSSGYGVIGLGGRNDGVGYVHRLMHESARGPIPAGYDIDHLCRNKVCANPSHLEAVTHAENMRRYRVARDYAA